MKMSFAFIALFSASISHAAFAETAQEPLFTCISASSEARIWVQASRKSGDDQSAVAHIVVKDPKSNRVLMNEDVLVSHTSWPKGTLLENGDENTGKGMTVRIGVSSFDTIGDVWIANKKGEIVFSDNEESCSLYVP